jgi:hypothetical protein
VAEPSDPPDRVQSREVVLEIDGSAAHGYHLLMSPAGCFPADYWYKSVAEAKESASQIFGVNPSGWRSAPPPRQALTHALIRPSTFGPNTCSPKIS